MHSPVLDVFAMFTLRSMASTFIRPPPLSAACRPLNYLCVHWVDAQVPLFGIIILALTLAGALRCSTRAWWLAAPWQAQGRYSSARQPGSSPARQQACYAGPLSQAAVCMQAQSLTVSTRSLARSLACSLQLRRLYSVTAHRSLLPTPLLPYTYAFAMLRAASRSLARPAGEYDQETREDGRERRGETRWELGLGFRRPMPGSRWVEMGIGDRQSTTMREKTRSWKRGRGGDAEDVGETRR